MANQSRLEAITKLQQIILQTEEVNEILGKFMPEALNQLALLGFDYQLLATVFLDSNNKPNASSLAFTAMPEGIKPIDLGILNTEEIFKKDSSFEKELFWEGFAVVEEPKLFNSNIATKIAAKSEILIFIRSTKEFWGVVVLASPRSSQDISDEERKIIRIMANQIGQIYRLQETSNSLTRIGQEVYKMNFQLHELDKLKDEFVSLASHELRTPLTAISSYLYMAIYKNVDKLPDKTGRYLTRAYLSTQRLINLVNEMLNVSRIESGRIEVIPKPFNLLELTKEVIEDIGPRAEEKGIKVNILESKLPLCFADADKVHEVLFNLVGNSLKFTPPGGNVTIGFFTDGKMIETQVKDSGVGISKEEIGRLFQKFGRLDSSYLAMGSTGGTGLGLYISKRLVELMHGKIWATSEGANKGSTFTFSLPVASQETLSRVNEFTTLPVAGESKGLEPVVI